MVPLLYDLIYIYYKGVHIAYRSENVHMSITSQTTASAFNEGFSLICSSNSHCIKWLCMVRD